MKTLCYVTATVGIVFLTTTLNGLVLCKLWAWFISTTFEVQLLNIPQALGLSLIISYITHQYQTPKEEESYGMTLIKGATIGVMKPVLSLFVGWIFTLFL